MSIARVSFWNPSGENHRVICLGSVHAWNTRSCGASITRVITISRSSAQVERGSIARGSFFWAMVRAFRIVRLRCVVKKAREAIEARLPRAAGEVQPGHRFRQPFRPDLTGAALSVAPAQDEPGVLQHLQMLRYRGQRSEEHTSELQSL